MRVFQVWKTAKTVNHYCPAGGRWFPIPTFPSRRSSGSNLEALLFRMSEKPQLLKTFKGHVDSMLTVCWLCVDCMFISQSVVLCMGIRLSARCFTFPVATESPRCASTFCETPVSVFIRSQPLCASFAWTLSKMYYRVSVCIAAWVGPSPTASRDRRLLAHSQHTVGASSTYSQHTVNIQSTYSQHTVNIQSTWPIKVLKALLFHTFCALRLYK